jgi:hypothetical protein
MARGAARKVCDAEASCSARLRETRADSGFLSAFRPTREHPRQASSGPPGALPVDRGDRERSRWRGVSGPRDPSRQRHLRRRVWRRRRPDQRLRAAFMLRRQRAGNLGVCAFARPDHRRRGDNVRFDDHCTHMPWIHHHSFELDAGRFWVSSLDSARTVMSSGAMRLMARREPAQRLRGAHTRLRCRPTSSGCKGA